MNNNEGPIPQQIARLEGIASTMRRSEGNRAPRSKRMAANAALAGLLRRHFIRSLLAF